MILKDKISDNYFVCSRNSEDGSFPASIKSYRATIGPSAKRHSNCVSLGNDDGPPLCTYQYFPQRGCTRGIKLETNPNPRELDTAPKSWDGKLDTSSGISKSDYIKKSWPVQGIYAPHIYRRVGNYTPVFFNCLILRPPSGRTR